VDSDRLLLGLRAMEREAGFCMALWSQVKFLGNGLLNECIGSKARCFLKKMFHCCQKVAVTDDLVRSSIKFIFPLPKTYSSIITCRKSRYIADMAAKSLHRMLLQEAPIPSSDSRMPGQRNRPSHHPKTDFRLPQPHSRYPSRYLPPRPHPDQQPNKPIPHQRLPNLQRPPPPCVSRSTANRERSSIATTNSS
jgi:hypothetical protein